MKKHIKIYREHFGIEDYYPCEVCGLKATDIHHIKYKSRGGKDEIENLMALCRSCHDKAHQEILQETELKGMHLIYICSK